MCIHCWEKMGSPSIINDKTKEAARLIENVYVYHGAGGYGHIVLDDWNLEDDNVEWCLGRVEENEWGYDKKELEVTKKCLETLLQMSEEERASALAIYDGFVHVEDNDAQ